MFAYGFILVVLCFFPDPIWSADKGISSYCRKSQLYKIQYPRTPIECCWDEQKCDRFIEAGETKYGLKNKNKRWSIRECSCDVRMYQCLKAEMSESDKEKAHSRIGNEYCFRRNQTSLCDLNDETCPGGFEIVRVYTFLAL